MMTIEKMAKVVSEINRGLVSSRPQEGAASQCQSSTHVRVNRDAHICPKKN